MPPARPEVPAERERPALAGADDLCEECTLTVSMDDLVALCKRRGFIFPASELYQGINGFWDYGPLGTELKNNLRDAWWHDMVRCPPLGPDGTPLSIVGVDTAIIQNPRVWEASGHVGGFNDPMVDCRETKNRYRHDHLMVLRHRDDATVPMFAFMEGEPEAVHKKLKKLAKGRELDEFETLALTELAVADFAHVIGPDAKAAGTLTEPRQFNLMFKTYVGAVQNEDSIAYLRPETAQGIFLNYKNVLDTMRVKVPFGIAQIGKAFRNEVTPRNYIFRSREFEQMEMEWFCHPDDAKTWHEFWCKQRGQWWQSVGLRSDDLQLRPHEADELAHYAKGGAGTFDIEYRFPFTAPGYGELEGVAHRVDFDLKQHQEHAKSKLQYFDAERKERYLPHVIEPAGGLTRGVLAVLCEAYTADPERPSKVYMKFHPRLAPIKAAIFPLVAKEGMPEMAHKLYQELRTRYAVEIDVKQAVGKRYARMDEAGTPYCFTIDGDSLGDQTVTVRDRDTAGQQRIAIDKVGDFLAERMR
ncbi:MAG: glycine--tRNA ligase [Myxococcales bacterium]|nr:glycine--tRNA ligase [Myxococcales bacterium]